MKTKYVCRGFISLYVNFHNNPNVVNKFNLKICRWGEKEKEPSGFTRLNMKTKRERVWHILISPHVNFHNDWTM